VETDDLRLLIRNGESQTLDFKKTITKSEKIARTLVAFANAQGGQILVGIDDHKHIIGIDPEEEKYVLNEASVKFCSPPIPLQFLEIEEEDKTILVVKIDESSQKPHFAIDLQGKMHLYIRVADKNLCS
jgi:predicted HTH transcriptional regulator